jgi:hypothetical protein
MAPQKDIHVTSKAIRKAGTDCSGKVKAEVLKAKTSVDDTEITFPYFGIIGIGIQSGHHEVQQYARDYLQAAADCLDRLHESLNKIAQTWENAEDASKVKHK